MAAASEAIVLGVRIARRTRRQALDAIRQFLAGDRARSVYFVHAATANLAFEDRAYCEALNRGDLVLNDGAGVSWAARSSGVRLEENLVGTDLVPEMLAGPFAAPLRVYLLGGRPGVARRAAASVNLRFPQVRVVGSAPGYFDASKEPAVVEEINGTGAELLLVGMGNPRQELFIDRWRSQMQCRVAIAVGGLLDHFAGELRRAPCWVRRLHLEWLQLLVQQPHKWRRYLLGIPKFLWRMVGLPKMDHQRKMGPQRRLAANSAVAALSLVMAVGVAEGLLRQVRPQILERYPEGLYIPSASRQYKLRPHFSGVFRYPEFQTAVRINGQGLRENREYGRRQASLRRVLAVGDSFTMGYSVEEEHTWVRRLEKLLGSGYQAINAGVPGYSTRQEVAYLEEEGLALEPDVVLLGFFIGNDIVDNTHGALPVELREGRLISTEVRSGLLPLELRLALARNSHLYHLARRRQDWRRQGVYEGGAEDGWRATAECVERVARLCAGRGIRLIVVLIPERAQTERWVPNAVLPNRRMQEICRRAGVEVVDLLPHFDGPDLYFPQDGHWTERGNAVAATAVAAGLRSR